MNPFPRPPRSLAAAVAALLVLLAAIVVGPWRTGEAVTPAGGKVSGTGEMAPVDGDPTDDRDRHVVTLAPETTSLVAPGRATAMDPGPAEEAEAQDAASGEDPAAQLAGAVPGIDEVQPLGDGRYAVVSSGVGADGLAALPGVVDVEEDPLAQAFATESAEVSEDFVSQQWSLVNDGRTLDGVKGRPGADIGWSHGPADAPTGDGVIVAVVDTGIDLAHEDLAGRFWTNPGETDCDDGQDDGTGNGYADDCVGWDFVNDDATVDDDGADNEHGTHVAGLIAANDDDTGIVGVAPGATIMPLKVIEGGSFPLSRAARAITYAVDNGADIVLTAWGTEPDGGSSSVLAAAIEHAADQGVLIVAAAGNQAVDLDTTRVLPAAYDHENVLTVGASNIGDHIAEFSNYGTATVDLFAPGAMLLSTLPDQNHEFRSGTSMAAPLAAGAAALVAEQAGLPTGPSSAVDLRTAILDGVVPLGQFAGHAASGGRLWLPGALGAPVQPADGAVSATFDDWVLDPRRVSVDVHVAAPVGAENLAITLGVLDGDAPSAVIDHPLEVTTGTTTTSRTAVDGSVDLALDSDETLALQGTGLTLTVATALPDGRYALMVGASNAAGDPFDPAAALFTVGTPEGEPAEDGTESPSPTASPSASPGSTEDPGAGESTEETELPEAEDPIAVVNDPTEDPTDTETDPSPSPSPSESPGASEDPGDTDGDADDPGTDPAPSPSDTGGTEPSTDEPTSTESEAESIERLCADVPEHDAVSPNCGRVDGGTVVRIEAVGTWASEPKYVHFGKQVVGVGVATEGYVLVVTSPRVDTGTVDVAVYGQSSADSDAVGDAFLALYEAAFTFVDPDAPEGEPSSDSGTETPTGGDGSSEPSNDPTDPPPSRSTLGDPHRMDNGLQVDAFDPSHPLGSLIPEAWDTNGCPATGCGGLGLRA